MVLSPLLERVAVALHAASSTTLAYHTPTEIWGWFDQWAKRLAIATRLGAAVRTISTTADVAAYSLPASNLSTLAVVDGRGYALERITVRNLDAGGPWQATAADWPERFSLDAGAGLSSLRLDPPPLLAQTLNVLQTEIPTTTSAAQPVLDAPAIAEEYLYFRTIQEVRARIGEGHMPEVAGFAKGIADLIEAAATFYWGAP